MEAAAPVREGVPPPGDEPAPAPRLDPRPDPDPRLDTMPTEIMLQILIAGGLDARDLGRLERSSPHFWRPRSPVGASICNAAAALILASRPDSPRVARRDDEPAVFTLETLQRRLPPPRSVAAGDYHTVAVAQNGVLWSFGKGEQGQLGHGTSDDWVALAELWGVQELEPRAVELRHGGVPVSCVAAGAAHSGAVAADGSICTWGGIALGQGARLWGSNNALTSPRPVAFGLPPGERMVYVTARDTYMACVTSAGKLFTWGGESRGRLGHGADCSVGGGMLEIPKQVASLASHRIVSVECGYRAMAAVTARGRLFMCGNLPRLPDADRPASGHRWEDVWTPLETRLPDGLLVRSASCGNAHFAAVSTCGALFTWGNGSNGQLGHGSTASESLPRQVLPLQAEKIIAVSCGVSMTAAVAESGALYTWGDGGHGRLGHGKLQRCILPRKVTLPPRHGRVAAVSPIVSFAQTCCAVLAKHLRKQCRRLVCFARLNFSSVCRPCARRCTAV